MAGKIIGNTSKSQKICGAKPTGNFILVEVLTEQEVLGTDLFVSNNSKSKLPTSPQGYVLDFGPLFEADADKWGISKGDRVVLQGTCIPVPDFRESDRQLVVTTAHDIKCILKEQDA